MTCPHCDGPDGVRALAADRCELVLYGRDHAATLATDVRPVIDLWAERTAAIGARPEVGYVLLTDATAPDDAHPHGEIYAFADVPPTPAAELAAIPCPICMENPSDRLITEGLGWRAWAPADSRHPYEVVLAPISHRPDIPTLADWERDALARLLADVLARFEHLGTPHQPHQLWVHQQPTDGRPWPNAHVHVEISAPRATIGPAELGSGIFFNPVAPAHAAADLRAAGPATP